MRAHRPLILIVIVGIVLGFLTATLVAASQAKDAVPPTPLLPLDVMVEETGLTPSSRPAAACTFAPAYDLYLCPDPEPEQTPARDPEAALAAQEMLRSGVGLLLIPDSNHNRVMAFDPLTGDLVDANFILSEANLATPTNAILSAGGTILVSDQLVDAVQEFDLSGDYLGMFVGGDTDILDNLRGMSLRSNGNLLVTVGAGANADAVAEFDPNGVYLGNFVENGAGGLDSPFDIYGRASDWLVGGASSDAISRYALSSGAFINVFASIDSFPEQIREIDNGNVLVSNFSGTEEGIIEYGADGTLIDIYDPQGLDGYRGVYELPNGNLLVTNDQGVHEINRNGNLVETKFGDANAYFIEHVTIPVTLDLQVTVSEDGACGVTDVLGVAPGADVTFCLTAENTGGLPLTHHTITDSAYGPLLEFPFVLEPNATKTVSITMPVSMTAQHHITWTAVHTEDGYSATAYDRATVSVAGLSVDKTVGVVAGGCAATDTLEVNKGTAVYYCLSLNNTGDVTLTQHTIRDSQLGLSVTFPFTLTPGAAVSVTNQALTGTLGLPPAFGPVMVMENVTNTLLFTATNAAGTATIMDTDTAVVTIIEYESYLPAIMKPE